MASSTLYPSVLTVSSGLLAGLGLGFPIVSVPAMLASSDPLPSFRVTYMKGSRIALTCIGVNTLTAIKCYIDNGSTDYRYLMVAGFSASMAVWTGVFMVRINNALFAIEDADKVKSDGRIRKLIEQWGGYQWARTTFSVAAFLTNVWIIFSK